MSCDFRIPVPIDRAAMDAAITNSAHRHYVYILFRSSGIPFYVGKGSKRRVFMHEYDAKKPSFVTHHLNVIRKEEREGRKIGYAIESWHDSHESAFQREEAVIALIGLAATGNGPLCNRTSGGRYPKYAPDHEARSARAKKMRASKTREEWCAIAKKAKANMTPEARSLSAKKGAAARDNTYFSRLMKHRMQTDPELRKKLFAGLAEWQQTDEGKASKDKIAKKLTAYIKSLTPEQRSEMAKKASASKSPEFRVALAKYAASRVSKAGRASQAEKVRKWWEYRRMQKAGFLF